MTTAEGILEASGCFLETEEMVAEIPRNKQIIEYVLIMILNYRSSDKLGMCVVLIITHKP